ncbi:MAG: hypothetical protein ACREXY_25635, partial [Gammaproteobacteria bacterium]
YMVGKTPSTKNPDYWSDSCADVPWVSISDMEHFGVVTNTSKRVTKEAAKSVFGYEAIPKGSLLMSFKLTEPILNSVCKGHNMATKGVRHDRCIEAVTQAQAEGAVL